jgi:diaminopimelate decarboxylase
MSISTATDVGREAGTVDRVTSIVREVLERRGVDRHVAVDEDLREAGLNSLDMVNLMLAIESEFELKIPDAEMTLRNFRTIAVIEAFVAVLRQSK